jgi:hypothetical protein
MVGRALVQCGMPATPLARLRARIQSAAAHWLTAAIALAILPWTADAAELSGFAAVEARLFAQSRGFGEQHPGALQTSVVLQPEFRHEWSAGRERITVIPFARLDEVDRRRTHADVRELSWLRVSERWDLLAGVSKVFWGVTESRHLVDIVNQTDLVEDPAGEQKLGQPMIRLAANFPNAGAFALFVLPRFRERTFPGPPGRLRSAVPVDTRRAVYESSRGKRHPDLALRWSYVLGNWDVGLAHFRGTSREPRLVPMLDSSGRRLLVPHYDLIDQASVDLQLTREQWIWKLEAIARWGHGERFGALVGGFEYTFRGVFGTTFDLGVLAEYLYDGRSAAAPPTAFDDDVFAGARLALNDPQSTQVLAGVVVDRKSRAMTIRLEASRRLGDRWTLKVDAQAFANVPPSDLLFAARRDHFMRLQIARYF